jgi:8-oxo-dGTP pyrophosphatase MutT (NUDIX family)
VAVDPRHAVPASAVAVVRPGDRGPEVLLVRRRSGTAFAGAWAFPGGAVEPIDRSGGARLSTVAVRAAARELGEETGIVAAPGVLEPLLGPLVATDADRRFAVRFFAFWTDRSIAVRLNPNELTAHRWLSPADALQRAAAGALRVGPATRAALVALNRRVGGGEGPIE